MKRLLIPVVLGLSACNYDPHQPLSADFGDSVRANIAAQVVNPAPTTGGWETDGERIQRAIRRYHTNTTYPPYTPNTSSLSGTGGGGGGAPMAPPVQ
jgi:hypothetical protein